MRKVFRIIQAEVEAAEAISGTDGADAIYERETVMKKYRSVLHPRHAFLTMLRYDKVAIEKYTSNNKILFGKIDFYL